MKVDKNLIVFITGGASGLGEETARRLHAQGCRVAIADLDDERLEILKKELKDRILTFICDVTKESDVKEAIEGTVKEWGTIHVALASAGVGWPIQTLTSKSTMNIELFRNVVDINFWGSMYMAKYASVVLSKNKPINDKGERGLILFISSVAAEEGQRG